MCIYQMGLYTAGYPIRMSELVALHSAGLLGPFVIWATPAHALVKGGNGFDDQIATP